MPEDPGERALATLAGRPALARLQLTGRAVATSGDYRNVREVEGRVVAHAIDPRTGRPIDHATGSVTVVAADCGTADGGKPRVISRHALIPAACRKYLKSARALSLRQAANMCKSARARSLRQATNMYKPCDH